MTIEPNGYKILKHENEQLKQDLLRTEELQDEIIQLERDKRYWLDNFKRVRDDKMNLIDENAQLKHEIDKQKNYNMSHAQRISELKKQNKTSYKPHEVFKLKQENEETKEIINNFREQNFELREDLGTYKNQYNKLFDEHEQLKQRVFKLVRTNTTLQNDLFSEQLEQDETEEYINRLKQELFNLYLKHY